jgi:6-phosphogluconolactonase
MENKARGRMLVLGMGWLVLWTSCGKSSAPAPVVGAPLLVTSQTDSTLASYGIDPASGRLIAHGSAVSTGAGAIPNAVIVTGSAAFVANGGSNDIARFVVNADDTLSSVSGNQAAGMNPVALAVDPAGKFLFVANQGDQTVSAFSISGTTLTPVSTIATAPDPVALVVAPHNDFVYVANSINGTISGYFFSRPSGALTAMTQAPVSSVGSTPDALAITPDGNFLYAANFSSNDVAGFSICTMVNLICPQADGSLVPFLTAPYLAGVAPRSMAMTPAGDFLFVANQFSNQISMFSIVPTIDPLTGLTTDQLKANNPAIISTGVNPVSIAIPSSGGFAFVANNGSASISPFTIGLGGILQLNGPAVATAGQPSSLAP